MALTYYTKKLIKCSKYLVAFKISITYLFIVYYLLFIKIHFMQDKPTYMKDKNKTIKPNDYIKNKTICTTQ